MVSLQINCEASSRMTDLKEKNYCEDDKEDDDDEDRTKVH